VCSQLHLGRVGTTSRRRTAAAATSRRGTWEAREPGCIVTVDGRSVALAAALYPKLHRQPYRVVVAATCCLVSCAAGCHVPFLHCLWPGGVVLWVNGSVAPCRRFPHFAGLRARRSPGKIFTFWVTLGFFGGFSVLAPFARFCTCAARNC
jgi:hypothetical protein